MNRVEDVNRVRAYYAERTFRNLRAAGISGLLPWDQFLCWDWISNCGGDRDNPDRFRELKQPGVVPDRLTARGEHINNPFAEFRLNTTGRAVHAGFSAGSAENRAKPAKKDTIFVRVKRSVKR